MAQVQGPEFNTQYHHSNKNKRIESLSFKDDHLARESVCTESDTRKLSRQGGKHVTTGQWAVTCRTLKEKNTKLNFEADIR
jgi:hypothetical protein